MTDSGFALRRLRRSPWFTLFAVVTLSLAIGVTTAVYSLVRTGLRPFIKVSGADRLLVVTDATLRGPAPMSWLDYQDVASQVTVFDGVAAWTPATVALSIDGRAEFAMAEIVSGNYFAVVGGAAWRGRVLDSKDADPASPAVAVISTSAWRSRMNADPAAIGRAIKLDGHEFQIVGIMPDEFRGIDKPRGIGRPDVWIPISVAPLLAHRYARQDRSRRDHQWLSVAGRLSPNTERMAAVLAVQHLSQQLEVSEPLPPTRFAGGGTAPRARGWTVYGVNDPIDFAQEKSILRMVLLLPTLVLLIACSNLANFALSRGIVRQNELAVRQALGASRWRLVRAQLLEYGVISIVGGAGGVLIAAWLLDRIASTTERVAGTMPQFRLDASIDGPVLVAVAGAALLSVLVAGLLPAWRLTGRSLRSAIDTDHSSTSLPRWRGRGNLIALQVSVSVALLLVSALVVRQIPKLKATAASGMSLDRIAVVTIPLSGELIRRDAIQRILDDAADRVRQLPGAASVSYASSRKYLEHVAIGAAGTTLRKGPSQPTTSVLPVASAYFETVGLNIVAGRPIGPGDTASAERVVVLNASLARALFGGRDAVGQRVVLANEVGAAWRGEAAVRTLSVVGVADDTYASKGFAPAFAYLPFGQASMDQVELLAAARDGVDPAAMATVMRDLLRRVDPDVAVSFAGRADAAEFGPKAMLQLFVVWFGTLAVLALGFAMSGLYGVLSHVVALRTRELGLRAALGADRRQLIALVVKDGARPVLEGVVIGFGIAVGARLGMQPWFDDPVTAVDPLALVIALAPLLAASWLACYLPARRAAAADPNVALKHL